MADSKVEMFRVDVTMVQKGWIRTSLETQREVVRRKMRNEKNADIQRILDEEIIQLGMLIIQFGG